MEVRAEYMLAREEFDMTETRILASCPPRPLGERVRGEGRFQMETW
jgi:hypothetical protein